MEYYYEPIDPARDLGGLCECFVDESHGARDVAVAHVHRHFELLYCLEGGYELTAARLTFRLREGDAALIHPMEPHRTRTLTEGVNRYLVLKFTPDALYAAKQPLYELKYIFPYLHFSGRRAYVYTRAELATSRMDELLRRILSEREGTAYGYEMAVRASVSEVLLWFIRAWHERSDAAAIDATALSRLQRALGYIEARMGEEISVADVAAHLGMGGSTFSRFFSQAAGMSFPAYVRAVRLSRAMALLVESDRSVTDIALETGFSTASYLILCFRRQYQMTPARFRGMYGRAAGKGTQA